MDSLIAAAARALVAGDALGALKRVGLRDDPPALALRGIAMAQLGEHPRARELLRRAARGFGGARGLPRPGRRPPPPGGGGGGGGAGGGGAGRAGGKSPGGGGAGAPQ